MPHDHHDHPHHDHDHHHDHGGHSHAHGGHGHSHAPKDFGRAFAIGVALNLGFVICEAGAGLWSGSLALLADAGHNLSDVLSLLMAWGAAVLARKAAGPQRTYGLRKVTILASLANAILLLVAVGVIASEAVRRFAAPAEVASAPVMIVAAIGVVINTATALMFMRGHEDLNVRGAFLHMAGDAAVSLAVVIGAGLMAWTGLLWIDPVLSLVIAGVIVLGTWGLLRDSVDLALDAAPRNIDVEAVRAWLANLPGVTNVHDLHIWAMSTTETAMTAHLTRPANADGDGFLHTACDGLSHKFGIGHCTLQVETGAEACHILGPRGLSALRPIALSLYRAATGLLEALAPRLLSRRAAMGKEDRARLGERLGRTTVPRPEGSLVWLHGVSVGESMSLLPLVEALHARRPDLSLLVTSGTRTSAELLGQRLPEGVIHQYAPIDTPGAVSRFLDHWTPDLGVLVESELWPNLILGAHGRGVKLALLSARITKGSADGWNRVHAAVKHVLDAFDLIAPQDVETEVRLKRLGARTGPLLNLKTVGEALPVDAAELAKLKAAVGGRRVVLAANTHPGEDEIIIGGFKQAGLADTLLMVAPRHPARGEAVAGLLDGFEVARRAAGEPLTPVTTAYVADTLGEMGLLYRLADVVVMGGAFMPGIGGHNPLEPARLERPILTGPHSFNASALYADLFAEAAAIEAPDAPALARHLKGLGDYPHIGRRMGEAALAYAQRQSGGLDTALALLEPLLPA